MSERDESRLLALGVAAAADPEHPPETSESDGEDDELVQAVADFVDDLVEDDGDNGA